MRTQTIIIAVIILFTGLWTIHPLKTKAQENTNLKKQTYKAYLTNSLSVWKAIEKNARKTYRADSNNMQSLLELTEVHYGLLNSCLSNQAKEEFEKYIKRAKADVETLLETNKRWAKAHALKAGLLSMEMAMNPSKGMLLGPKSGKHIAKAIKYDSKEPLAWFQKGGSKLHTPKMFGGNDEEAVKHFQKAVQLYESDTILCKNNWQYINTLAWLGNAYAEIEKYDKARATYEKALKVEPEFHWVRHVLMKKVQKGMKD